MSDIFVEDESNEEVVEKKQSKKAPASYLKVKLSSKGKLNTPSTLHVRNYTGADAMQLALASEEDILDTILQVLGGMVWEDIDVAHLHEKELEEILMNIYINFWSSTILDFPYPYTQEELEEVEENKKERIQRNEYRPSIDIPHSLLQTVDLAEEFKEPITITIKGEKVAFRLPRLQDVLDAKNAVAEMYETEAMQFSSFEKVLQQNASLPEDKQQPITPSTYKAYISYLKNRGVQFERRRQASTLISYNGKTLDSLQDKLDVYDTLDLLFWKRFNEIVKKHGAFGLENDIEVTSPLTGKKVTRRFQFRLLDFIPAVDEEDTTEYSVVFG